MLSEDKRLVESGESVWYLQTIENLSERFASRVAKIIDGRIILMSVEVSLE